MIHDEALSFYDSVLCYHEPFRNVKNKNISRFMSLPHVDMLMILFTCTFNIQKQPPEVLCKKKVFLEISQNPQGNTCARVSFLIKLQASRFIKKETMAQVLSCKFREISKNTFSTEHLRRTAVIKACIDTFCCLKLS